MNEREKVENKKGRSCTSFLLGEDVESTTLFILFHLSLFPFFFSFLLLDSLACNLSSHGNRIYRYGSRLPYFFIRQLYFYQNGNIPSNGYIVYLIPFFCYIYIYLNI